MTTTLRRRRRCLHSRRRPTLVIFLKAPRLGTVKTRLARSVGDTAARRIYLWLSVLTIRRVANCRRWSTVLATTPRRQRPRAWPHTVPVVSQGDGDLGQRLARISRRLARPKVLIIGSDAPGLTAGHINRAFQSLAGDDFVFGPADDGGFWLIGWRRLKAWPPDALRRVRWSSDHALADSRRSLGANRTVAALDQLADIDTVADLGPYRAVVGRTVGRPPAA